MHHLVKKKAGNDETWPNSWVSSREMFYAQIIHKPSHVMCTCKFSVCNIQSLELDSNKPYLVTYLSISHVMFKPLDIKKLKTCLWLFSLQTTYKRTKKKNWEMKKSHKNQVL